MFDLVGRYADAFPKTHFHQVYLWSWVIEGYTPYNHKVKDLIGIRATTQIPHPHTHICSWNTPPLSPKLCVHTPAEVGGLGPECLGPHVNFLTSKIPSSPRTNRGSHSIFPLDMLCVVQPLSFFW